MNTVIARTQCLLLLLLVLAVTGLTGCGGGYPILTHATSYAVIPNTYDPGTPHRWVLYLHGYASPKAGPFAGSDYKSVVNALVAAGYVVVGMQNNIGDCYGNALCVGQVGATVREWQSSLNLAPHPFVMAASMGGFTLLNALSHDAVNPPAVVGWCLNTNLAWDYGKGGAKGPISYSYNIGGANTYAEATLGYDPMLASPAVFRNTPMMLWASYEDTIVRRADNTDPFAELVNNAGGTVSVVTSSGNHLDASNFDPAAVVDFFNAH